MRQELKTPPFSETTTTDRQTTATYADERNERGSGRDRRWATEFVKRRALSANGGVQLPAVVIFCTDAVMSTLVAESCCCRHKKKDLSTTGCLPQNAQNIYFVPPRHRLVLLKRHATSSLVAGNTGQQTTGPHLCRYLTHCGVCILNYSITSFCWCVVNQLSCV